MTINTSTKNIELLLQDFSDQQLTALQAAAEGGRLVYRLRNCCLVHHHRNSYFDSMNDYKTGGLAKTAEMEFYDLGYPFGIESDKLRQKAMLPLIQAEWVHRAKPMPVTFKVPETQEVK